MHTHTRTHIHARTHGANIPALAPSRRSCRGSNSGVIISEDETDDERIVGSRIDQFARRNASAASAHTLAVGLMQV